MPKKYPTPTSPPPHRRPKAINLPAARFTRADVLAYYLAIAPTLLPHLRNRALTMKRFREEAGDTSPPRRGARMRPAVLASTRDLGPGRHCVVNDAASLAWVANLAVLELHVSLARIATWHRPTVIVFDLLPGDGAGILDCAQVALWLHEQLEILTLASYPKTSGKMGLQVYVPLNTPTSYKRTAAAAQTIAQILESAHPDQVVANPRHRLRRGKVLIDWGRNRGRHATVCAYSLRAAPVPLVSTPLSWREVNAAHRHQDAAALRFTPERVLARLRRQPDLFAPVLTQQQIL